MMPKTCNVYIKLCHFIAATALSISSTITSASIMSASIIILTKAHTETQWRIIHLGTLPVASFSLGLAINEAGQVVGSGEKTPILIDGVPTMQHSAFISGPGGSGVLTDLGFSPLCVIKKKVKRFLTQSYISCRKLT